MHCDDKRTISALKQYILDAQAELHDLQNKQKAKTAKQKTEIQNKIKFLEKSIKDSQDQLLSLE